jgi:uncharacterized protein (TIGR02452 family)
MNLIKIMQDTLAICENLSYNGPAGSVSIEEELDTAICGTEYFSADDIFELDACATELRDSNIELTTETTAQAGRRLAADGHSVAILNYASAQSPGGGCLHGTVAQEEDLCRVSGLYPCLTREDLLYYKDNKACGSSLYTDGMIYSQNVPFFKDEKYSLLEKPFLLSVITCPAPNMNQSHSAPGALRPSFIKDKENADESEIKAIFKRRVDRVLSCAVIYEHRAIVLGVWGAGAFGNDSKIVARAFNEAISDKKFENCFDQIVFAIPDRMGKNYIAFNEIL